MLICIYCEGSVLITSSILQVKTQISKRVENRDLACFRSMIYLHELGLCNVFASFVALPFEVQCNCYDCLDGFPLGTTSTFYLFNNNEIMNFI